MKKSNKMLAILGCCAVLSSHGFSSECNWAKDEDLSGGKLLSSVFRIPNSLIASLRRDLAEGFAERKARKAINRLSESFSYFCERGSSETVLLNLSNNSLLDYDIAYLPSVIISKSSLLKLDLSSNGITPIGAKHILHWLIDQRYFFDIISPASHNQTLAEIDLRGNKIPTICNKELDQLVVKVNKSRDLMKSPKFVLRLDR
ncbi:hypothetical protein [Candidatus Finniella inopinata]|uniref:Leucine-rich repeat domain-containing protein n=1 Tax=Candidatus Finniella inopinata TaxID=1696036 RepID=A0A4Q7DI55_9PROT|nr:hypothetical protein [Candidatus Finniella inopinata]RZI46651.1 hypothetical protein EQU50_03435 [Candidatus Finniella inopinata]